MVILAGKHIFAENITYVIGFTITQKQGKEVENMRREARQERQLNIAQVAGYHHGNSQYQKYGVFASDRMQETDSSYHLLKDGSLPAVIGIEWESEVFGITNHTTYANLLRDVVFKIFPDNLWKIESDCTLGTRNREEVNEYGQAIGAECITQPMTKAFIRNQYCNFKAMYEMCKAFGIDNAKTGHCGQHAHISLTCFGRSKAVQDEAIRKLFYIVNRHYDLICALLYRRADRQSWCGRMDYRQAWTMDLNYMDGSHSNGCNYSHYRNGNIELRIPGGQKDYPCFRNTMESIFHLIEVSKTISRKDCDDIVKIFSGCNQHVFDRLRSYCYDRGTITVEQLNAIRETVKTVDFR